MTEDILMGNEAVALGLLEAGCNVISAYPGTPSSEVLPFADKLREKFDLPVFIEWSVNEKCAFELVYGNAIIGGNSAVIMKQVGLNVALDPLMSAAYIGHKGAMVVVVADDPGPISSQTEQDSRFLAMFAKLPVLDPSNPEEAKEYAKLAIEISRANEIPVILRLTGRVAHSKMNIKYAEIEKSIFEKNLTFEKNPFRWAAIPKFRYLQHIELNKKITNLKNNDFYKLNTFDNNNKNLIITSGICYANILDALNYLNIKNIDVLKIFLPFPVSKKIDNILEKYSKILLIEENYPVLEYQIRNKPVSGRLTDNIPSEGELTVDKIINIISDFFSINSETISPVTINSKKPELCAGCPHRNSFYAIKKAFPNGIFPSDIGCYTLGLNMGAVDTCLCMGACINQASGFYHGFKINGNTIPPIIATIGDSTFYHSGVPALVNSIYNKSAFVLVILDNSTVAMTGFQPTPNSGVLNKGEGNKVSLEKLVKGCGVKFLKIIKPSEINSMIKQVKEAWKYALENKTVSVIIAKEPCAILASKGNILKEQKVFISDKCTGCKYCIKSFQCPAIIFNEEIKKVKIDESLCIKCGVCVQICPENAIVLK
jgi:indolepyruvate ferredoxin oxidoreductase alpha subunit